MKEQTNVDELERIYTFYKFNTQVLKLAEECAELIKACLKLGNDNSELLEGIADVEVVIQQFKNHYPDWEEEIEEIKNRKINLVLSKIEAGS